MKQVNTRLFWDLLEVIYFFSPMLFIVGIIFLIIYSQYSIFSTGNIIGITLMEGGLGGSLYKFLKRKKH